jgi:hypothetical protein
MKRPIPWHLIMTMLADGHLVDTLAAKFNVPASEIQRRAALSLSGTGYVRTTLEIKDASNQVKSDLTTVLVRQAADLAKQQTFSPYDITKLTMLVGTAAKLFAWPNPKAVDPTIANPNPKNAINLELIKTTPEQMRDLAKPAGG